MESKLIRYLGSVRLAVPLLSAIAIILIGATFYESQVGSATIQHLVYKSPWFGALMFLLALNLGVSTALRYPWRGARKIGFALTHIGLIVIIAGSAAVIHLSTEGMLLVRTDRGPSNEVRVEGDILDVIAPDQSQQQADIFIRPDGSVYPTEVGALSILGYSENATNTVAFAEGGSVQNLAVKLQLKSDRMGQTLERWLAIAPTVYQETDIGPAQLALIQATDESQLKQFLSPSDPSLGEWGRLHLTVGHQILDLDVKQTRGKITSLQNGLQVQVTQVWPDFRLTQAGQPATASEQFRNPAVQLQVIQGDRQEQWYVFSQPEFEPIRSGTDLNLQIQYQAPSASTADYFRVVADASGNLHYATRSSKGFSSGNLQVGDIITPGWADFKIQLTEVIPQAKLQRSVVPVTPVAQGIDSGSPALHVAIGGIDQWIAWGEPTTLKGVNGDYFAAFSPKRLRLPFTVQLNDFIVERNEGSESVAMWTSDITLRDSENVRRQNVWMNHPTWFKGWKLAQASWNPGDLNQSTLQLKREPWWVTSLTWLGSLLVVTGIGTMFYGRTIVKQLQKTTETLSPSSALDAPETEPLASQMPSSSVESTFAVLNK